MAGTKTGRRAARASGGAAASITVVNMIPRSLSQETNQDSEPMLAVNPANPLEMVGTAFTPDPMGGSNAPIYVSTDGGNSWRLNTVVPSIATNPSTSDISVAFGTANGRLYAGILSNATGDFETLRAPSA